ncbi:hypothetical protein ACFFIF_03840 [Vagococcus entomophilus]|uniref:Uncharacterized protein n=1 Tax=Vagococcus entomophilus TaxID=1160095 RepID=A0A430AJJ2_9ENTE|nr:hypothetical protein [Vagococcus entomophilus]RSU08087.1 hypothetical protein CBF30_02250 [Vagococcus entomophilus]
MRRILGFLSFVLLIWLHISYGSFGIHDFWHNMWVKIDVWIKNANIALMLLIPVFSFTICSINAIYEKNKFLKSIFFIMLILSVSSLGFFIFVFLVGTGTSFTG